MLELKNIRKVYKTADDEVEALKGVSIKFRESEFVAILGQSGCGKTTLLNIIGGLDRYTSGDLIINNKSTKKFKDKDWDAYRNYKIGFVFQSYNLISHQTVLSNVELALTLGGVSKKERKQRAIKALEEVGLKSQIHKKPNQLSGGQMQRVAIARALVNNPDIILADEPTGALDTKTSIQVMDILKEISKNRLIIMVTHNPELAEKYSTRIINILDGEITHDSNPIKDTIENNNNKIKNKDVGIGKTKLKFWTAFRLSLNNLLTKKGRTILVAFAGSIGIIGIALIQAVSNGFQNYVDHIQEETLTSYPLTIMQESSDLTSVLLSMTSKNGDNNGTNTVKEEQYVTNMLSSISTNDLKSFKKYLNDNYDEIDSDIATIKYSYSVDPLIYTIDASGEMAKLNPNNLFTSMMGSSSLMTSYSSMASIYSQMMDNKEILKNSYDVLEGRWPEKYDELVIVLSEKNSISDLLVYSLGLRKTEELTDMVTKIMRGESVDINNEPLTLTYQDLMNVDLRLIRPTDMYKYNSRYDVYEDMSADEAFFKDLYDNSIKLKVVGVVSAKDGVTTMALNPGVAYTSDLIEYIIDYSNDTDIVQKQINNTEIDVISGSNFNEKSNGLGLEFSDLVTVDSNMLQNAFNINIDEKEMQNKTQGYMNEISNSITTDITPAKNDFNNNLNTLLNGLTNIITGPISLEDIDTVVNNYLDGYEPSNIIKNMEGKYVIPQDVFKQAYSGLLKAFLQVYISTYCTIDSSLINPENPQNLTAVIAPELVTPILNEYTSSSAIMGTSETMAKSMTETVMKKDILSKVGELMNKLTQSFASSFNVNQDKIAEAFKLKMTEEELTRIITAMLSTKDNNAKTNLISLGYQDKDEPTYISFYFNSFEGKERFIDFVNKYNEKVLANGEDEKEIKFTDTTGILMNSVKIIVNAVTYVLIAFVSISLVVSSIMIGIITYISVYERTKEIGILRAIGASKHNISTIFNAETFIIGLLSGSFGIGISLIIIPIINTILHHFTGNIPLNATLEVGNIIVLVTLSVILTLIGGLIPAKKASKKDPVIALRTE